MLSYISAPFYEQTHTRAHTLVPLGKQGYLKKPHVTKSKYELLRYFFFKFVLLKMHQLLNLKLLVSKQ